MAGGRALACSLRFALGWRIFARMTSDRVPQVDDAAPDGAIVDERRRALLLSELWARGPLVLLFFRGEWDEPGLERLRELRDVAMALRKEGAELAAISTDEVPVAAWMRLSRALPFALLCDPQRILIERFGLTEEHARGKVARPAAFVIDRAGKVRLASVDPAAPAELILRFVRAGRADAARPPTARLKRALRKLRAFEQRVVASLRALKPRRERPV